MVIGREVEQRQLLQALEAEESQFIAVFASGTPVAYSAKVVMQLLMNE